MTIVLSMHVICLYYNISNYGDIFGIVLNNKPGDPCTSCGHGDTSRDSLRKICHNDKTIKIHIVRDYFFCQSWVNFKIRYPSFYQPYITK